MTSSDPGRLVAVIMAGGAGTRFWPLSRQRRPKQLLPLAGGRSLLSATVERVLPLAGEEHTYVVTGGAVADAVRADVALPPGNVLAEPVGRDTAACIGWAAWRLVRRGGDPVMVVLPADHVIPDGDAFRRTVLAAAAVARDRGGLVTLAIRPTRPETGFGYLELSEPVGEAGGVPLHRVDRFVEKPSADRAAAMLAAGRFRWNAGMFVWRVSDIVAEIRRCLPELAEALDRLLDDADKVGEDAALARAYPTLPRISIDFGVMEKAQTVWAVPADFTWSDVGSWPGLAEIAGDAGGGVRMGDTLVLDSDGSVVVSDGPLVAVVGAPDLVVVATGDAVLVVPRAEAQRVKELVERLRDDGRTDLL